jgi:hypothetical protein
MAQANTNNSTTMPVDQTRRQFLSQAAGVAAGSAVLALATVSATEGAAAPVAALPSSGVDPIFTVIARHRAEQQAYGDALVAQDDLDEIIPKEIQRPSGRVQWGMKGGEPYYLYSHEQIDHQMEWSPDFASGPEIRAKLHAEFDRDTSELSTKRDEYGATAADDRVEQLCDSCQDLAWALANTVPISIAGVVAVLQYANECEDGGEEWPDTDTIGSEGWHYQLRQTAARALETIQGVGMV